jgi:DNA invertase Pin-like site-specific DNA recombinase
MKRMNGTPIESVAIYLRHGQSGSRKSRRRQARACSSCATSIGAKNISVFDDNASGSIVGERPGLSKLLDKCKHGEVETVVVEDFDRLSRSWLEAAGIADALQEVGVTLREASNRRPVEDNDLRAKGFHDRSEARRPGKEQDSFDTGKPDEE